MGTFIHPLIPSTQHLARYENGSKLSGIIYLHRISDERFTGISVRNFRMFRQLCGDSTLKNVALVTNMWGKVTQELGEARERELVDKYFKAALDKGAQLVRHYDTTQSSHDIIRHIMKNDPTAFQIQRELVDEGKNINNTAAGVAVSEEIDRLIRYYKTEVKALGEELRQALKSRDEETRIELEKAANGLKEQIKEMRRESEIMAAKYNEEKQRMEEVMKQMRMRMQEQARQEKGRAEAEAKKLIEGLTNVWNGSPGRGPLQAIGRTFQWLHDNGFRPR